MMTMARGLLFIVLCLVTASPAWGAASAAAQAGVFKKVFTFNKGLRGKKVQVLAVFDDATKAAIDGVVDGFTSKGMSAKAVALADLAGQIGPGKVVYTLSGADSVGALCAEKKVLSITGDLALVQGGKLAVSVSDNGGKMLISVHLARTKAEGQVFAPTFLKLAKVIR
jgi:hypothetical protein